MKMKKSTVVFAAMAFLLGTSIYASADLVTNGGFETGTLSSWAVSGSLITEDLIGADAHTGSDSAELATTGTLGSLSQALATTAGHKYHLSFWLANSIVGTPLLPNEFEVKFGSTLLFARPDLDKQSYTNYTFDVTATGPSILEFDGRNDGGHFNLDDVSVTPMTAVPELSSIVGLGGLAALSGLVLLRRSRK